MHTHSSSARHATARDAVIRSGAVLLIAASLGSLSSIASAADQVERDDTTVVTPEKPAPEKSSRSSDSKSTLSKEEMQARLQEAQKRLEAAANEVGALSVEMAGDVLENVASAFNDTPRRTVIGVQLRAPAKGVGAVVQNVSPGGPADQAGIKAGDVIVAVSGKNVTDAREVVKLLRDVAPSSKVPVRVMRDGKARNFDVEARPYDYRYGYQWHTDPRGFEAPMAPVAPEAPEMPEMPGPFAYSSGWGRDLQGLELTMLTPTLGRYFGTDKGVLVVRAPEDDLYKLQDGDVIVSIDGRVPGNASQVARILRSYQAGETLTLHLMRDRKPLNVELTVPGTDNRARRSRTRFLGSGAATPL